MGSIRLKIIKFFLFISFVFCAGDVNLNFHRYVQVNCNILDFSGQVIKRINSFMCVFLDDGSMISASYSRGRVLYMNKYGNVLWKKFLEFHHELELSSDKKFIFLLSSDFIKDKDQKMNRYDVFEKRSVKTGEVVGRWSTYEHWNEMEMYLKERSKRPASFFHVDNPRIKEFYELTHVNSIHVIPKNALYPKLPYMRPGNLLTSINCLGMMMIFDNDFRHVEKAIHYENQTTCNIHDAQVLPNGHILFFRNYKIKEDGSSLVEFDPESGKIVWEFANQESLPTLSVVRGSVQLLPNGNYLVMDVGRNDGKRVVEMDKRGRIAHAINTRVLDSIESVVYRARIIPLQKFLDNNHNDF